MGKNKAIREVGEDAKDQVDESPGMYIYAIGDHCCIECSDNYHAAAAAEKQRQYLKEASMAWMLRPCGGPMLL